MSRIQSGRWLDISGSQSVGFSIQASTCLRRLAQEMPEAPTQTPRLWAFIGAAHKDEFLQAMFAQNAFNRVNPGTAIRLRSDVASWHSKSPIFFTDSDPWNAVATGSKPTKQDVRYPVQWSTGSATEVVHGLHCQVLFPLADVVCIFADDLSEQADVTSIIANHGSSMTSLPSQARPHLIIVAGGSGSAARWPNKVETRHAAGSFSAVSIFPLAGGEMNLGQGYDRLKGLLARHSEEIQNVRQQYIGPLSALQLDKYVQIAIAHFAKDRDEPFDLISASRAADDIPADIGSKIDHVHQVCIDTGLSNEDSAQFIASALIMDHYRPDMPLMSPRLVFQTIYHPKISPPDPTNPPFPTALLDLLDLVESAMTVEFARLQQNGLPSLELRKQFLISRTGHYSLVKSNRVCLYCLLQPAQHFPSCDHPLCDRCARLFGTAAVDKEYQFQVDCCLLCGTAMSIEIDALPPTMDPTVIAIDGGGTRAVIPLTYLILIQEYLEKECHPQDVIRLQDVVHLFIGTSSGGLIGIGLIPLNLSVPMCAEVFDHLARCVFKERRKPAFPWMPDRILGRVRQWWSWLVHDSCYDGTVFDAVLQNLTGAQTLLHNPPQMAKSCAKLGVVATGVGPKTKTVIFGNFNTADGIQDSGYRLIRPLRIEQEPRLSLVGRATAAAPSIFPTVDTPDGSFQDGGLTENFSGAIARRVSRAIWPSSCEPARLLSFGTGSSSNPADDHLPHFRHIFRDGFVRRAFSAWMTSLDAGSRWREMKSQLDETISPNFRRLDIALDGPAAPLDDITMMDHYRDLVLLHPGSARMAKDATLDLLTARFFFELDTVPSVDRSPFWCHGTIWCKGPARSLVARLQDLVPHPLEFATDSRRLGPLVPDRDICPSCNRLCWPVSILCHGPDHAIHIYLKAGRHGQWGINPFPTTPAKLIQRQKLHIPFGKVYHDRPSHQPCSACDSGRIPFRGRRRRLDSSSSSPDTGVSTQSLCALICLPSTSRIHVSFLRINSLSAVLIIHNPLPTILYGPQSKLRDRRVQSISMTLNQSARERVQYNRRIGTILKKLWEFRTLCKVEAYILLVHDREVTVVNTSDGAPWPSVDETLESHFPSVIRYDMDSLAAKFGAGANDLAEEGSEFAEEDLSDIEIPELPILRQPARTTLTGTLAAEDFS